MRRAIPATLLVLLFASCDSEDPGPPQPSQPSPAASAVTATVAPPQAGTGVSRLDKVTVREGDVVIAFTEDGAAREMFGELRDNGKRKYTFGDGQFVYEVKAGDDGFKLRNPDGTLRWKVKLYADKIKISDNEKNERPFQLKNREAGRFKIVGPGEEELGNVRFAAGKIEVEGADGRAVLTQPSAKPSAAYGVMLLETIPLRDRCILVAELLSRDR
jgi:hypothetical protein